MSTKESLNLSVYNGIKSAILHGEFLPGDRLEGRALETKFQVSSTPVRSALYRLYGENLIEQNFIDGLFHVPALTERGIQELYILEDEILGSCLRLSKRFRHDVGGAVADPPNEDDPIIITEHLFRAIADASMNGELGKVVTYANDRLRHVRLYEAAAVQNRLEEILQIQEHWLQADYAGVTTRLKDYHRVRISSVRRIITAAERSQKS